MDHDRQAVDQPVIGQERQSAFTPGPWSVGTRKPYVEVWGPMRMGGSPILATMESEPREANARLISAAPDMLAALKGIATFAQMHVEDLAAEAQEGGPLARDELRQWSKVLSAITKAEGR